MKHLIFRKPVDSVLPRNFFEGENEIQCPSCKKFTLENVNCMTQERKDNNCVSYKSYDCCCTAVACKCGFRKVFKLEAPECKW